MFAPRTPFAPRARLAPRTPFAPPRYPSIADADHRRPL